MSERHETMLIDDFDEERSSRGRRRAVPALGRAVPGLGRPIEPVTIALIVAGVLALIGISFAVIAPLTSGSPSAQTLPPGVGASGPPGSAAPSAHPSSSAPGTKPPSAAPSPSVKFRPDDLETAVVRLTNDARKQASCRAAGNNGRLHTAARVHSTDMAQTGVLSSTGSDGASFADRAQQAGYRNPLSENIAHGQTTAADVVQYWLSHSASRLHLLDCNATAIGVGVARAPDGSYYWTQDFGN